MHTLDPRVSYTLRCTTRLNDTITSDLRPVREAQDPTVQSHNVRRVELLGIFWVRSDESCPLQSQCRHPERLSLESANIELAAALRQTFRSVNDFPPDHALDCTRGCACTTKRGFESLGAGRLMAIDSTRTMERPGRKRETVFPLPPSGRRKPCRTTARPHGILLSIVGLCFARSTDTQTPIRMSRITHVRGETTP